MTTRTVPVRTRLTTRCRRSRRLCDDGHNKSAEHD